MKIYMLAGILASLCLRAQAQADVKPLTIGDTLPKQLWEMPMQVVNHPQKKNTITLADYKGKLIILDFWATWCISCIAAMPKTHHLQQEFGSKLVILPVTYENADKADSLLTTNHATKTLKIAPIVNDSILSKSFPHQLLPHFVWISQQGLVSNITSAEQVTEENIQKILENNSVQLKPKNDLNRSIPIFLPLEKLSFNHIRNYSLLFKGRYDGLPTGTFGVYNKEIGLYGVTISNRPLIDFFEIVAREKFKTLGEIFSNKLLAFESADSSDFVNSSEQDQKNTNRYTYCSWADSANKKNIYDYLLSDLTKGTGYTGYVQQNTVNCLILTDNKNTYASIEKKNNDNRSLTNISPSETFVSTLNLFANIPKHVINAVSQEKELFPNTDDLAKMSFPQLKKQLEKYGLHFIPMTRVMNVFVIKKL